MHFLKMIGYWVAGLGVLITVAGGFIIVMMTGVVLSFLGLVGKVLLALTIIFQVIFTRDK
jgi:uncharacterized membrane protein